MQYPMTKAQLEHKLSLDNPRIELKALYEKVGGDDPMYQVVNDPKLTQEMQNSKFLIVLKHFFWYFLQLTST